MGERIILVSLSPCLPLLHSPTPPLLPSPFPIPKYLSKELILRIIKFFIDFSRCCNKNALLPCLEFQDSNPKKECPQMDMYLLVVKSSSLNIY